jgi:hypothetical protein
LQIINTNSQEKITLKIYNDGVLQQADSGTHVTLSIYDADNDSTAITGFSGLTAVDETPKGIYSYRLTPAITNINRTLEVKWVYTVAGVSTTEIDFYKVETPYADVWEVVDFFQFGSDPSSLNYIDPVAIANAEKVARTIIEGYTGIKFYTYYGSQETYGIGSNRIQLTEKMLKIDQMYENQVLVYDGTQSPVYDTFGYTTEISPSGYQLRIWYPSSPAGWNNEMDPTIYEAGRFRDNYVYKFVGQIGYKYVPEDIKLATMLLINDVLSNDYNWRNKYLAKVNLSEISFEMAKGAFNGTGNITVDNILDQYRKTNIVII